MYESVINEHLNMYENKRPQAFKYKAVTKTLRDHGLQQGMRGSGLLSYVKNGVQTVGKFLEGNQSKKTQQGGFLEQLNPINIAKSLFGDLRTTMPPAIRQVLQDTKMKPDLRDFKELEQGRKSEAWKMQWLNSMTGMRKIVQIQALREPIIQAVDSILNKISLGTLDKAKDAMHIDELFHLYTIIHLDDGRRYRLEKNQVISLYEYQENNVKEKSQLYPTNLTMFELFKKAEQLVGGANLYIYRARDLNCQHFTTTIFKVCGVTDPNAYTFINQDTEQLFSRMPDYVDKIANTTTNIANRMDALWNGYGIKCGGQSIGYLKKPVMGGCLDDVTCPCNIKKTRIKKALKRIV